jgi:hypothetical protein
VVLFQLSSKKAGVPFMSKQLFIPAQLKAERAKLNRLNDGRQIHNNEEAIRFIDERGFILLMPIADIPLPSLSQADDAATWDGFAITDRAWAWKETLPGDKLCAYTKLIHGRGTFISWRLYPAFVKLYGPEGEPDYEYENGRLDKTERDLYRIVAECGPIDSRELWRRAKALFGDKRSRFTATLERLQSRFYLTVSGGSLEGWTLHTWDLVERQVPQEVLAELPSRDDARASILWQTIQNCYAIPARKLRSLLRWSLLDLDRSLAGLRKAGQIIEVGVEGDGQVWFMAAGH